VVTQGAAPRARRPPLTTIEAIEKVALELFVEQGFEETPIEEIAAAAGISRRTFFRYFASKNDIPFGHFDKLLQDLDAWLASQSDDRPMFEVIVEAVQRFNRFHSDGPVAHRERMELILHTPALRANSALRNAEWVTVVAAYAARRMREPAEAFGPQLVAHVAHAAASVAYEQWLRDKSSDLMKLIRRAFSMAENLRALEDKGGPPKRRPTQAR
jgi:TetR/AcrR family transcriptional regulator, regulator of mycofactocin system